MSLDKTTVVVQGEYRVSRDPHEILSTVLGSCVAVCLWDVEAGVGGMNHFLLPSGGRGPSAHGADSMRYGVNAMEMLINALLKQGARRHGLQAKAFGGARIAANLNDIGAANVAFAQEFLATEGIPCVSSSLGGTAARRVTFRPCNGQARQMMVPSDLADMAAQPVREVRPVPKTGGITLF